MQHISELSWLLVGTSSGHSERRSVLNGEKGVQELVRLRGARQVAEAEHKTIEMRT